ncbi:MAG TPA: thioredoxin [Candidatus Hydrogenedentes bacterium]|nr:thioredoxin [Candidatus Hydrogenedentota bacterium]
MSNAKELNSANFDETIAKGVTLVDFWAEWCGPCRVMGPHVDAVARQFEGKAVVAKVNVDEEQQLAIRYGINSIPAFILFKDGQPVDRLIGVVNPDALAGMINKYLEA